MDGSIIAALGVLLMVIALAGVQSQRRRSRRRAGHGPHRASRPIAIVVFLLAIGGVLSVLVAGLILASS